MPFTPIDRVAVGQVLDRPVTNVSGVTLVRSGTALTAPLLARLRDLGFLEIDVMPTGEALEHARLAQREALDVRFRGHEHNALMMQLKDLLVRGTPEHGGAR